MHVYILNQDILLRKALFDMVLVYWRALSRKKTAYFSTFNSGKMEVPKI